MMSSSPRHILINGLSIGSGGGFSVAVGLLHHFPIVRPDWKITCALTNGNPKHGRIKQIALHPNAKILWAPPETASRAARRRYESTDLRKWCDENRVDALHQLNGMTIPAIKLPTFCHMQDPWPYRPQAWDRLRDRAIAFLKRREHRRSLQTGSAFGWTSAYLRDLICGYHHVQPAVSEVLYNGVADDWLERSKAELPAWGPRKNQLLTVSNVGPYKRQSLVIEALALIARVPGLEDVSYRIIGECSDDYRSELLQLAARHGVVDRVTVEGRLPDEQVAQAYASAKCFVLMSVCESFGIPPIEAMTFGTPVVVCDACALPEVCDTAAEIVPADDVKSLADRVVKVMLDTNRAEDLRRRGAERVGRFTWTPIAEQIAKMLEKAIDSRR